MSEITTGEGPGDGRACVMATDPEVIVVRSGPWINLRIADGQKHLEIAAPESTQELLSVAEEFLRMLWERKYGGRA